MVLFIAAVVVALLINDPRKYHEVDSQGFAQMLDQQVWESPNIARGGRRVAELQADLIKIFQGQNLRKAKLLGWALASEVAAVAALGLAVGTFLRQG
jgi:hypothetical protein